MEVGRRIEKLRRLVRWRRASGLPLWWHVGRPNFGDDINPSLFQKMTGTHMRLVGDRRRMHLLGAGSILAKATTSSVVCGSGFLEPPGQDLEKPAMVSAVRGALSLAFMDRRSDIALGDPLLLIADHLPSIPKRYRFGLVPHVLSVGRWRSRASHDVHLVDPGRDPWIVAEQIAACDVVISQSLHGLIVADALNVPNVWVAPSDQMVGGRFKFDDYFSTIERPKECVPECHEVFKRPAVLATSVEAYRFGKDELRKSLVTACRWVRDQLHPDQPTDYENPVR